MIQEQAEQGTGRPTNLKGSNKRTKAQIDRRFRPIRETKR
ncbi:unnamed protein product [Musa hybrid cultivar]